MNADWSFLPTVPLSFDNNNSESLELALSHGKTSVVFNTNNTLLSLTRPTEPKDVSLEAQKESLEVMYQFNDEYIFYIFGFNQKAKPQIFNCYEFSGIILGGCESASFSISSSNPKYNELGENIISLDGDTSSQGIGFKKNWNNFWIYSSSIEISNTNYEYDWLSPIEDIKSPFLLNLSINGTVLGDGIDLTLKRLPQRDKWSSTQINFELKQKFVSIYNFSLVSEYGMVLIQFDNYQKYQEVPKFNLKLRLGIEFVTDKFDFLLYGDMYKNNLIGYEPITFNQRTEHYFDKAYGEIGASLKFKV